MLVLMRSLSDPEKDWAFPSEAVLDTMFDEVVEQCDDDDIVTVALGSRVDPLTRIATVTLSTLNLDLFFKIIDAIHNYNGHDGYGFITFSKAEYVSQNTATIYVPKRFQRYGHKRMFRVLFSKYPALSADYIMLHEHTFTEDIPGMRSRIGDKILVIGGAFLKKLAAFHPSHTFELNAHWRLTIRGGCRNGDNLTNEQKAIANSSGSVPASLSETIMKSGAQDRASNEANAGFAE